MSKNVLIIGAGIAGLAAGCYAQMNGYDSCILEMHDKPGGLCTAWRRKGYTFDGCIHHLAGSGPNSALHSLWQELGAVQRRPMIYHDDLVRVEGVDGRALTVYVDPDRLEEHLVQLSPADAPLSRAYAQAVRRFRSIELLALMGARPMELLKVVPLLPAFMRWGKLTLEDYAGRFSDAFLRSAWPCIQYDFAGIPTVVNLGFLAACSQQQLGWPVGGSLEFARAIERRYLALGGEVQYKSRVSEILVEGERAVGVRLADGGELRSERVISAADGHTTVYEMLQGRYQDERIRAFYAAAPEQQNMNLHVSLGVARDLTNEPHALTFFLQQPVTIAERRYDRLDVENYAFDPTMAPAGKSAVKVLLESRYAYWRELAADRARYEAAKQQVAEAVIAQLETRFPGLSQAIEVSDVATPLTIERYTGNYQGLQAWGIPNAGMVGAFRGLSTTLPGLEEFYMVGQWAMATIGLSTVAIAARKLVRRLCREDQRPFVATVPS